MDIGEQIVDVNSVARYRFNVNQDWNSISTRIVVGGQASWIHTGGVAIGGYPWLPLRVVVNSTNLFWSK